jgi:hypothetical protein
MILYQLECDADHAFEAWFRDSAAFDTQSERGLLTCPACGSAKVSKALMAPRIGGTRSNAVGETLPAKAEAKGIQISAEAVALREKLGEVRRTIEESCDYVGPQFAEEARKIHYGETDPKGIYGETSADEAKALKEEGIEFGAVPWLPKENA